MPPDWGVGKVLLGAFRQDLNGNMSRLLTYLTYITYLYNL